MTLSYKRRAGNRARNTEKNNDTGVMRKRIDSGIRSDFLYRRIVKNRVTRCGEENE